MFELDHRRFWAYDFALINPLQVEERHWRALNPVALAPRALQSEQHLLPRLVTLRELPKDKVDALFLQAHDYSASNDFPFFSALFVCSGNTAALLGHLERVMMVTDRQQNRYWLRYHDSRVFMHLRWMLSLANLSELFGPIATWDWFDILTQSWCSEARPVVSLSHAVNSSLRPSASEWRALQRIEALNACLQAPVLRVGGLTSHEQMQLFKDLDALVERSVQSGGLPEKDAVVLSVLKALELTRWRGLLIQEGVDAKG